MGAGKTSVARKASRACETPFRDSDALVSRIAGKPIAEIFSEDGEEAFRELEHKVLNDLLSDTRQTIISTGGGVVLRADNRHLLNEHAVVLWLQADISSIAHHLSQSPNPRPLVPKGDVAEMEATLTRLQDERHHLYKAVADITLNVSQIGQSAAVEAVIENVKSSKEISRDVKSSKDMKDR